MKERLQKIMAAAGIASRRKAEELIVAGKVKVNRKVVTELGAKADPAVDRIEVDGRRIGGAEETVYYAFHKPPRVMTTMEDPQGRPCVGDYLKHFPTRLYPVGRLDFDSEGLLLITNDGDLTAHLTHPKHGIPKTYQAKLDGGLTAAQRQEILTGKAKGGGRNSPLSLTFLRNVNEKTWWEIVITEGRNRQVRKIFEQAGRRVLKLRRVAIGGLTLGELPPGQFRRLDPDEIYDLKNL